MKLNLLIVLLYSTGIVATATSFNFPIATPTATKTTFTFPTATRTTFIFPTATRTTSVFPTATRTTFIFPTATRTTSVFPTATRTTFIFPTATPTTIGTTLIFPTATRTTSVFPTATRTTSVFPTATRTTSVFPTATRTTLLFPTATRTTTIFPTATRTTSVFPTATRTTSVFPTATGTTFIFPTATPTAIGTTFIFPTATAETTSTPVYTVTAIATTVFATFTAIPTFATPVSSVTSTATQLPLPNSPKNVSIRNFNSAGSSCPAGSAIASIDSNGYFLSISLGIIDVSKGHFEQITEKKSCQVNLNLDFESGWQYRLTFANSRGHYQLENLVTATQKFANYFTGDFFEQQTAQITFNSGVSKYSFVEMFSNEVWSPCSNDAALYIISQVRIDGPGIGYIAIEPVEGDATYKFSIDWRRFAAVILTSFTTAALQFQDFEISFAPLGTAEAAAKKACPAGASDNQEKADIANVAEIDIFNAQLKDPKITEEEKVVIQQNKIKNKVLKLTCGLEAAKLKGNEEVVQEKLQKLAKNISLDKAASSSAKTTKPVSSPTPKPSKPSTQSNTNVGSNKIQFSDIDISNAAVGTAEVNAKRVCPAGSPDNQEKADIANKAEVEIFNKKLSLPTLSAKEKSLIQQDKIKNKVLKLTCGLEAAKLKGNEEVVKEKLQKLAKNISLDKAAAKKTSKIVEANKNRK
ncbi:hypothetical protein HK099_004215 [Clydaea vesicula]|uniref:Uncharacterized protein n=1 Tax=Clydaea vesicula TaxID=447962 RepID=A0AAD5U240_9FUNG|nr:hypothetical protein HK099_004215 [Clydaea vesicula]